MIRLVFGLGLVLCLGVLGVASGASVALAEKQCLDEPRSATGKPSAIGELARANAFFTWKSLVKAKDGAAYNAWSEATERKLVCIDLMTGENAGKWECTRTARPCLKKKNALAPASETKCKKTISSAYGSRESSKAKARAEAIAGWALAVKKAHGDDWVEWEKATQKKIDCQRKPNSAYQCVAVGYACFN